MTFKLLPLAVADTTVIEQLLDTAFGLDRHGRTAYRLRAGTSWLPELSFAAFADKTLVGCLQSWPIALSGAPLILVGPVAVTPAWQGAGIGHALMQALIAAGGNTPMTMIGDPDYYGRWGFTSAATGGWQVPGPVERHRLLARSEASLPQVGELGPQRVATTSLAA